MKNLIGHTKTVLLLAALAYILFLQMCGTGKPSPCPEIVKETIDTQRLYRQWISEWSVLKPDTIIHTLVKWNYDTVVELETVHMIDPVDTAAILQDYFAKVVYKDSRAITDSTGMSYGTAIVEDTISQNRIQARRWRFDLSLPVITKTVTVTQAPRAQLYLGFNAMFGQTAVGGNINLSLKTKRDQIFTAGAGLFGQQLYGEFGTKFKLSFK